jgi:VanZ family protein
VRKLRLFLKYWLPVTVWMALIFSASSDTQSYRHTSRFFEPLLHWLFPQMPPATVDEVHHFFRKTGHFSEYAVLALLLWRAIHHTRRAPVAPKLGEGGWRWEEAGLALSVVFLYAASDELHQVFVALRTALVSDVVIDTTGGLTGLLLLWLAGKIFKRW